MSTDLFDVEVIERRGRTARLRLLLKEASSTVSAGPSFALMLIADDGHPQSAAYQRWLRARWDEDDAFDPLRAISRVAASAAGATVEVEVVVDVPGMLAHLEPGARWGSTAFDELDDGILLEGPAATWERPPVRAAPVSSTTGFEIVAQSPAGLWIDLFTPGQLLAPDPAVWFEKLQPNLPGLASVRHRDVPAYIAAVVPEQVEGERDPVKGRVTLANDLTLRVSGALRARYHVQPADAGWLADRPRSTRWLSSWLPDQALVKPPPMGTDADLATFRELLELAALEDLATQLDIVGAGLDETRVVVLEALARAVALGPEAAPLAGAIARLVGSADDGIAAAAVEAALAVGAQSLVPYLDWATWRL